MLRRILIMWWLLTILMDKACPEDKPPKIDEDYVYPALDISDGIIIERRDGGTLSPNHEDRQEIGNQEAQH